MTVAMENGPFVDVFPTKKMGELSLPWGESTGPGGPVR